MKNLKLICLSLLIIPSLLIAGGHKLEEQNLKVVDIFWENILTNPKIAMDLIHEDFEF